MPIYIIVFQTYYSSLLLNITDIHLQVYNYNKFYLFEFYFHQCLAKEILESTYMNLNSYYTNKTSSRGQNPII